jgi:hypothetical protein
MPFVEFKTVMIEHLAIRYGIKQHMLSHRQETFLDGIAMAMYSSGLEEGTAYIRGAYVFANNWSKYH